MSGHRGRSQQGQQGAGASAYSRSLRVNQVLRQIVAEELERLADADERLRLVTVTSVETSPDLRHATVYVGTLDDEVAEALDERRAHLQHEVGRQVRMKRTPVLQFAADPAIEAGARVEEVLRRLGGRIAARGVTAVPSGEAGDGAGGELTGMVVVDKEPGFTSHDVVARCRRIFGLRRVGHAGTLDPDATGVLLVGLGRATRLLRFLSALPKTYRGQVVLGTATSTLDSSGDVVGRFDMSEVGIDDARRAALALTGPIEQVPPMVSAVKVGGRPLHALARQGIEVERSPRPVTVLRFDLAPSDEPGVLDVEVECSSGTYIRVLADDLGKALGGGAHLRRLRRTAVGPFTVDQARPLEVLGPDDVRPPADAVAHLDAVTVSSEVARLVGHGRVLERDALGMAPPGDGPWAVLGEDGALLAVYETSGPSRVRPSVVLVTG